MKTPPSSDLFRIKICGITRPEDALATAEAGADAIGLNFFPQSTRFVDDALAESIVRACPPGLQKAGVFVNEPIDAILRRVMQLGLDWVQLHGDEPAEVVQQLNEVAVIRAFRCQSHRLQPVVEYLEQCQTLGHLPRAVLLDAWHADRYGGTGRTLDWEQLRAEIRQLGELPWILAGGLRASNVADAVATLHPHAVDTASGVESTPGIKNPREIAKFVAAARHGGLDF